MRKTRRRLVREVVLFVAVMVSLVIWATVSPGGYPLPESNSIAEPAAGYPDLFAQHFLDLKTAAWETEPSYPQNYRVNELQNARRNAKSGSVVLPWVERGPANVGGRTRAIVVDPGDRDHDTWFAASVSGGIWKTENAGLAWQFLTPDLPNLAFSTLVQAASDHNIMYAGTGEGFFNGDAVPGAGIFKSTDRGFTWIQLTSTAEDFDFRFVNRLVVSPTDPRVVVAATREGIFRSDDGGNSWSSRYSATSGPGVLQVIADPSNFSRLYASESGVGVLRSDDAGLTWQNASGGLTELSDGSISSSSRLELAIAPSNTQRLYASVESFGATDKLFMSPNGGDVWVPIVAAAGTSNPDFAGTQGWYDNAIAVDPFDENHVYVGGVGLYEVQLGGVSTIRVITTLDEENTIPFLDFVEFQSSTHFEGRMKSGLTEQGSTATEDDLVSVEVRFGPGRSQMAHRFTPPDGPGIEFSTYPYADYVEVPFEVWDITNNRQLAVSFRDRLGDGAFNLIQEDSNNLGREYLLIHADTYTESFPNASIARTGGPLHKLLYFFWPILAQEAIWNPATLPNSTLRINVADVEGATRTTTQVISSALHVDQHIILPIITAEQTQSFELLVGNDGGVFHSTTESFNFIDRNRTYNTSQFYGIDKRPGVNQFVGGTQDNGTWRSFVNPNSGQGWLSALGGDGIEVAWNQEDGKVVLGSVQFNDIRRSVNEGQTWTVGQTGLTDVGRDDGGQFLTTIDRSSDNPDHVFTIGRSGVWKSTNFGASWSLRPIPASEWGFGGSGKVRVSLADGQIVWAGYEMGLPFETVQGHLQVSTDGGETFTSVPTPEDLSSGRISGIATHPSEPSTAYALFSSFGNPKILRTEDLGQTWEDLSGFATTPAKTSANGFPNVGVNDLLVIPGDTDQLWAGTEIGIFISEDAGDTWFYANNGLPAVSIYQMRIVDDQLIVATHGRGIFTLDTSAIPVAIAEQLSEVPEAFSLDPNYPNPFNPSTTLSFSLPNSENVKLEIFDMEGRRVSVLIDARLSAGSHQIEWNAHGLASGTYISRLTAGQKMASETMVLLK